MLNKKLSLILLAAAAVVELTSLVWIRGEYRSTMIDGAEYQVPAAIDFKGDFYERNYRYGRRESESLYRPESENRRQQNLPL